MKEIAVIYKIRCYAALDPTQEGESCSLMPWNEAPGCRGNDDGGKEYVLPEGYTHGENENGIPVLLNKDGKPCGLILHNDCPMLVDSERRFAFLLEPVKKIATYRELAGLSRAELAEKIGVSQKELFEWENVEKQPDKHTLGKIAAALNCKMSDLI